jgi:hypothetical protein
MIDMHQIKREIMTSTPLPLLRFLRSPSTRDAARPAYPLVWLASRIACGLLGMRMLRCPDSCAIVMHVYGVAWGGGTSIKSEWAWRDPAGCGWERRDRLGLSIMVILV